MLLLKVLRSAETCGITVDTPQSFSREEVVEPSVSSLVLEKVHSVFTIAALLSQWKVVAVILEFCVPGGLYCLLEATHHIAVSKL